MASGPGSSSRSARARMLAWALSLVGAGVLLWLASRQFPLWPEVMVLPRPALLALAVALHVPYTFVRALRLAVVLDPLVAAATDGSQCRLRRSVLYGSGFVSFFVVFLLPFRLGELSRPVILTEADEPGVGLPESLTGVALERVVDGLIVCGMLFGGLAFADPSDGHESLLHVRDVGRLMLLVFMVALLVLVIAARDPAASKGLAGRMTVRLGARISDKIAAIVERFALAIRTLGTLDRGLMFVVWSLVYWAITAGQLWAMLWACGLSMAFASAMAIVAIIGLAIQLPGGPAQAGSFQFGASVALTLFVDPELPATTDAAATFSALMYLLQLGGAAAFTVPGFALLAAARRGAAEQRGSDAEQPS